MAAELARRSVRLVAGEFGCVSFSRQTNRLRLLLQAIRKHLACSVCAIKLRPDEQDGAALEAMGTDAGSAMLVLGHAGYAVMLGTENLIVNDLATECVVREDASDASFGRTVIGSVKEYKVHTVVAGARCLGVCIRLR